MEKVCSVCGKKGTQVIEKLPIPYTPVQPPVDPVDQKGTDGTAMGPGASVEAAEEGYLLQVHDRCSG